MIDTHHKWNGSFKPQFIGFVLSLSLLVAVYRIVMRHHLSDSALVYTIFALAVIQAFVQLVFFLHVGFESKPRWNTITFLFTAFVIFLVVGGSLWIMNNLNYNLMRP